MSVTTVKASGLTCNHCAMSVSEELEELTGVNSVKVEVVKGGESSITIDHEGELSPQAVETAIDEAGFKLVK